MATGSDMYYEHVCSPCKGDGLNNEARRYCRDCDQKLCDPCVKQHNRFFKDHTVLGHSDVGRWYPAKYDFPRDHVFSVKTERKINVRVKGNKENCKVNDMCYMHDGRIMFVDYNNGSLKLLNNEYRVVNELRFPRPYLPNGVSHIKDDEYVATVRDGENRKVVHFRLNGQCEISNLNTFLVNHKAGTIRHCNDHFYIQSDTGLCVYSMSGTLKNVLFRDISSTGCDSFAISDNGEKIHVSHRNDPSITTITENGERLASWTDKDLKKTPHLTVLPNGAILVCGFNDVSGRIKVSQLSTDGRRTIGTLIDRPYTDMLPIGMCYNPHTCELVVGGIGDTILVLTLQ